MNQRALPHIGISAGDLSGIGLQVVLKSLSEPDILRQLCPIIYCSQESIQKAAEVINLKSLSLKVIDKPSSALAGKINVLEAWKEELHSQPGRPDEQSGRLALASLELVTRHLQDGKIDALVTAPIDKQNIQSDHFRFPGHTEYLAEKAGNPDHLMLLVSGPLRVGVVTGHIPVSRIAEELSSEKIYQKIGVIHQSLRNDFGIDRPKIAVLGLNPHAGDRGLIGKEEELIIMPALDKARQEGIQASGPFPADGFFGSSTYSEFDAILAMYHDQGLVPFKALSFGKGVNFTAGLPFIRTSPDHGTAYDRAVDGNADSSSFIEALKLAVDLATNRAR